MCRLFTIGTSGLRSSSQHGQEFVLGLIRVGQFLGALLKRLVQLLSFGDVMRVDHEGADRRILEEVWWWCTRASATSRPCGDYGTAP